MTESKVPQPPSREMIRQTLIELLEADTGEKYPDLDEKTNLREGLGLDSFVVFSIVSQVELVFRSFLTMEAHQTLTHLRHFGWSFASKSLIETTPCLYALV